MIDLQNHTSETSNGGVPHNIISYILYSHTVGYSLWEIFVRMLSRCLLNIWTLPCHTNYISPSDLTYFNFFSYPVPIGLMIVILYHIVFGNSHPLSYCIRAYRLEPQYSHDIVEINHHCFGRCRIWRKHYILLRLACAHRTDTLYIIAPQKGQQCLVIHRCQLQQQESHWSETLTYHNSVDIYGFFMIHFTLKYRYRKAVYFT